MRHGSSGHSISGGYSAGSQPDAIAFYRSNEKPYGAFSNLYKRAMTFESRQYPTAEHAYQAAKARKESVREWILSAPSPSLVAMAAHGLYVWDVAPDWSKTKFDRMKKVLHAKFGQHEDLADLLLSTGDARLVEAGRVNNAINRTWGEVNGRGKNMLGVLLMEVRTELRAKKEKQPKKRVRTRKATRSPRSRVGSNVKGRKTRAARLSSPEAYD